MPSSARSIAHASASAAALAAAHDAPFTLITGPTSGIGRALATQLAERSRPLILAGRSPQATNDVRDALLATGSLHTVETIVLDLTSFDSVERCIDDLVRRGGRIAQIVCNAGVHVPFREIRTADGLELHMQVNCSSQLMLVLGLLQHDILAPDAQILYITSEAHRMARWPSAPLGFWHAYARSKEEATASFLALAARMPSLDVRLLSPGTVDTAVGRHKPAFARVLARALRRPTSAAAAATTVLAAAATPRLVGAAPYYHLGQPARPAERTLDPAFAVAAFNRAAQPFRHRLAAPWAQPLVTLTTHAGTCEWIAPRPAVPASNEAVARLVKRARAEGKPIRVIGKLHSYNDCARSEEYQVSLERLIDVVISDDRHSVLVGAGASIRSVCDALDAAGLTLPWGGNYGEQTLVGAALTGTHGYARHGGLMAQLITQMTIVDGRGELRVVDDEDELRCLRVSFGALGIVVAIRVAVSEKGGYCRYHLEHVPTSELLARLEHECVAHDHVRFFPSRIVLGHHAILAIDHLSDPPPPEARSPRYAYIDRGPVPAWLIVLVRFLLASRVFLAIVRRTRLARATMTAVVPFSSYLFINAGITTGRPTLARALYQAWNDDRTHNASFGIPVSDYGAFHDLFHALVARFRVAERRFSAYYTARYVGAQDRAYLGASFDLPVVMLDIHVSQDVRSASEFLTALDRASREAFLVRPHWGKQLFADGGELRRTLPAGAIDAMRAVRRRNDPDGVFSSPFTRRVLGD